MPASVWSKAGSIERMSDGTSRPVQPTSSNPAQARMAAIVVCRGESSGHAADASGRPRCARRATTGPPPAGRACKVGAWHEPPSRPSPAASCSSSTARTRPPRAWSRTVARIEDQVRARGWDVTVVAPEWRRRSDLRLGNWTEGDPPARPAVADAGPDPAGGRSQGCGHEDRDELLRGSARGAVRRARRPDAGRRHRLPRPPRHRSSEVLSRGADTAAARAARGRPVLPVALSLGGIALVDLLASWPEAPVEACVTVGSQAPLLYTFDAIPSMPYDEADPPHLPVPWLNIYDTPRLPVVPGRAALPALRTGSPAWSTCGSGRARTSRSRTAPTGSSGPVWDAIATAFTWRRVEPLTVREARRLGFEARVAPIPRE